MARIFTFLFLFCSCIGYSAEEPSTVQVPKIQEKEETLSSPPAEQPVKVETSVYLWRLIDLSEKDGNFRAEFYIDCKWKDPRLALNNKEYLIFNEEEADKKLDEIWWPELDFINGIDLQSTHKVLTIYKDGTVVYSAKILGLFFAQLDLRNFPFDEQYLKIHIESFYWDADILQFVANAEQTGAIEIDNFNGFHLHDISTSVQNEKFPFLHDTYSDFTAAIHIKRNPSYFVYQSLVPLILIFIITCCMFLLEFTDVLNRITLIQGCFFVAIATKFTINDKLPAVDYFTWVDYIFFAFYFFCLLCALASVIDSRIWKKDKKLSDRIRNKIFWLFVLIVACLYAVFYIHI